MPFMKGLAPVRRTKEYLEAGKMILHPDIKAITLNYNVNQKASVGAYEFMFWHFPQIKYKNRHLQMLRFKNMTPQPFLQLFFVNKKRLTVDLYGRSREEIHDHILESYCVSQEMFDGKGQNPAKFGKGCRHHCICEYVSQVQCPAFTELPRNMRGKFKDAEDAEGTEV